VSESIRRAVLALDVLAGASGDLSVREIAERAEVSKSAVQRVLSALLESGLVVQHASTRRYALGPRTLVLGTAYQSRIDLATLALPHLTRLRDATGETVGLTLPVGEDMMHVAQVESRSALRRSFDIGRPLPLWCGAPGRVFLAELPDADVERIVRERRPAAVVPAAPLPVDELLTAVRECRRRGHAEAFGETIAGVNTVAAGLRGTGGRVVATVSVTGPAVRLDEAALLGAVPLLRDTVAAVGSLLGHRDRPEA
jgi:DNA-binding IclR family transcriptional regulator